MQTHEQMRQEMINLRKQAKNMPYDRVLVAGRKILRMPINRYWYEMIASGEKQEEYREMSKHWVSRLVSHIEPYNSANCLLGIGYETIFKEYDLVEFKNGYGHKVPTMLVECRGIGIGKPKAKWCGAQMYYDAENGCYDDCFIIELGKVFF